MRDGGYEKVEGLAQFMQLFPNEEACRDHLFRRRWPQGFICPRCGYTKCYPISSRDLYQCAACRYQASVTAGTVMEKTRTSLMAWFLLVFLMARSKTGLSVLGFSSLTGISYKRAWLMSHKVRAAMEERDSLYLLADTLEMDESYSISTIRCHVSISTPDIEPAAALTVGSFYITVQDELSNKKKSNIEVRAFKLLFYHSKALVPPGLDVEKILRELPVKNRIKEEVFKKPNHS